MKRRLILSLAALALAVAGAPSQVGAHPAESRTYVGGFEAYVFCGIFGQGPFGGACFEPIPSDARAVTIRISDAHGLKVGATWAFRGISGGTDISSGGVCGTRRIIVPQGGGEKRLLLWLHTATQYAGECANEAPGSTGPATTGTVTATWSHSI